MDDTNFDDLLKSKFDNYEHPDLGPAALATFHTRVLSFPSVPWYAKYRTEVFVTISFIFFSLLNGFIVWYSVRENANKTAELEKVVSRKIVDSLTLVINKLNADHLDSPMTMNQSYKGEITVADNKHTIVNQNHTVIKNSTAFDTNSKLHLGMVASLNSRIFDRLSEEGVVEVKDGEVYLIIDRIRQVPRGSHTLNSPSRVAIIYENDTINSGIENVLPVSRLTHRISLKMINRIAEQKYTTGIGINLTPHFDLVSMAYSQGLGSTVPRIGITAEWIVSPHWSIETSVDYLTTKMTIDKNFQSFSGLDLNTELGSLDHAEISTRALSTPLDVKYRWWLTQKHQFVIKAGYTPYFSLRTQYVYNYPYPGRPVDSDLTISTMEQKDQSGYYGGTSTIAVGLSRVIKRKNQFEVVLFYEKSLGKVGLEKLGMQLFGVRTAYSFRVK